MSQRQCGRAEPPACCGPLRFSVLSGREKAPSDLGLAFRVKLSRVVRVHVLIEFLAGPYLHDQARGCSRYFPRPLSSLFDADRFHALHAVAAQAPCLCRNAFALSFALAPEHLYGSAWMRRTARLARCNCLIHALGVDSREFPLGVRYSTLRCLEPLNGNTSLPVLVADCCLSHLSLRSSASD